MERSLLRGRGILAALACLALVGAAILAGCGVEASAGGSGQPVAYDAHPGSILVQLFPSPGFIYPSVNGVPTWTLYGDGTLVFVSGASDSPKLSEARLTLDQVQHILDVVVNQNAFFASDKPSYGHIIPDTGATLLTVNANGQSKTVEVYGGPGTPSYPGSHTDTQTQHIFAIEGFLQSYHPATAQPYVPEGVAVAVYPSANTGQSSLVRPWPNPTVDLAQVAVAECPFLQPGNHCPAIVNSQAGILPIYGPSGTSLLSQLGAASHVMQNGATYLVVVWPLMPDVPPPNAHPTSSGAMATPHIRVAFGGQIHEWPLMSDNGVPTGA